MSAISASVGKRGVNRRGDVLIVQGLLKESASDPGAADGVCGPKTVAAIERFQQRFLHRPDGLIEPGKLTWTKLTAASTRVLLEWQGDSSRWPEEKKLRSLKSEFRPKVQDLLSRLIIAGFKPKIFYGWRSVQVQEELYKKGRTKVRFSFHNVQLPDGTPNACAADIIDARFGWSDTADTRQFWDALGTEAKNLGLVWGGDWTSIPDYAHVQFYPNSLLHRVKEQSGL